MFSARAALERISHPEWDVERIQAAISIWKSDAGFAQKTLMTVLRYALTGSKVRSIEILRTINASICQGWALSSGHHGDSRTPANSGKVVPPLWLGIIVQ